MISPPTGEGLEVYTMCKVTEGSKLTTINELQNFVTATIMKSDNQIDEIPLVKRVFEICSSSPLAPNKALVKITVHETLLAFVRAGYMYEYGDGFTYYKTRKRFTFNSLCNGASVKVLRNDTVS